MPVLADMRGKICSVRGFECGALGSLLSTFTEVVLVT